MLIYPLADLDMIKVGCCGFPIKRGVYYQNFSVVEIQETFYHLPRISTGGRWKEEAPFDFEFTMKAWQLITHESSSPTYRRLRMDLPEKNKRLYGFFKRTEEVDVAWSKTAEFAGAIGARKILFQSPKSFDPSESHIKDLKQFFKEIKRNTFTFIWEPRGQWEREEVEGLCEEMGIIPCLDPLNDPLPRGDFIYVRLHGKTGYRYTYSEDDLKELLKRMKPYGQAYLMFNNMNMVEDAQRLKILSKGKENHPRGRRLSNPFKGEGDG
jgi:uncharacterized protein YecE (DUF72 family)